MSNLRTFFLLFVFALFIAACGGETTNENETDSETDVDTEQEIDNAKQSDEAPIICLWSAVSIRETPDAKGKWKTTIYMGEKGTYLGETVSDTVPKKPVEYVKIKLTDGTAGWVEKRFMAIDAEPYALKESSKLYGRPDILSAGKDEFGKMQYVVAIEEQDEWVKVKGVKKEIGWYKEGWVKKDHLTSDEIDVTVAVLAYRAMGKKEDKDKLEALNEILENTDLSSSQFFSDVRALVDEL
ncbi:MAG: hypothetical protein HC831_26405, partial [Chloroflexia bacterium]|nr:hypothetical protein [Chloroflexia bacterium]